VVSGELKKAAESFNTLSRFSFSKRIHCINSST
jgi:hypothetical protein